jgi:hypothetical protein
MTRPRATPPAPGKFATPDVTVAQISALVAAVAAQIAAWGWINDSTGRQLVSLAGIILPAVWAIADSIIRHGRATGSATK